MKDESKGRLVQKAKVSFPMSFTFNFARIVPSVFVLYLFFLMF